MSNTIKDIDNCDIALVANVIANFNTIEDLKSYIDKELSRRIDDIVDLANDYAYDGYQLPREEQIDIRNLRDSLINIRGK